MNSTALELLDLSSPAWSNALKAGLGARLLAVAGLAAPLAVFRAGPFSLAYPDFPVGGEAYRESDIAAVLATARAAGIDAVRFHSAKPLAAGTPQALGTQVISDLRYWSEDHHEKARRTRNRATRSAVRVERASSADADLIHRLYLGTLGRHRGQARYGLAYFSAIAECTTLVARLDGQVVGFVSTARHGNRGLYLHGGHDPAARSHYPSDLLFRAMLLNAREHGLERFDFLPSPAGQESLQRYKQAWGAEASPFFVTDVALRPLRAQLLALARRVAGHAPQSWLRRLASPRRLRED